MTFSKKVRIVEGGPRDGLQNEAGHFILEQLQRAPTSAAARALAAKKAALVTEAAA